MKKLIILLFFFITACASNMSSDLSSLKTCLTEQALEAIQNGTVVAAPIKTTVKNMLAVCASGQENDPILKQLAQTILTEAMKQE